MRATQVGNLTTFDWSIDHKADPVADDKNKEAFSAMCDALPASEARFVRGVRATVNAFLVPLRDSRVLAASELATIFRT